MPMSGRFQDRLFPALPDIAGHFGTPFHIYDEVGIRETVRNLYDLFGWARFREYFAVKALPNLKILEILLDEGCGFDCSSMPELVMVRMVGADSDDIMFTSNNTSRVEYKAAFADEGCILNLDDATFVEKVPDPFPQLICFRYNPGPLRKGGEFIGNPEEAKYGVRDDQIVEAYKAAVARGASRFGLHTMIISNERDYTYMVETVRMLLGLVERIGSSLGTAFEFINIGGGIGIPYQPDDEPFDLPALAATSMGLFQTFGKKNGYTPKLFMESGRAVTGPHGVLVTRVINKMEKHRLTIGVDASMSALMRPGMYKAYHHITVVEPSGEMAIDRVPREADVVGSLCENNDKFAIKRFVPMTTSEGDFVVIHDTGAHGHAMGFQYNGRLRPKELLLRRDGGVELIRREETLDDYLRTQTDMGAETLGTPVSEGGKV